MRNPELIEAVDNENNHAKHRGTIAE